MPRVLNKRTDEIPSDAVYVGRPSKWGNPFKINDPLLPYGLSKEAKRDMVIQEYRKLILCECAPVFGFTAPTLEEIQKELKGKDLVCWCSPLPCHADILLELANRCDPQKHEYCPNQPDSSRLLTDEAICKAVGCIVASGKADVPCGFPKEKGACPLYQSGSLAIKAYASICKAQEQKRVEEIFKKIEKELKQTSGRIGVNWLQSLKQQEGYLG